MFWIRLKVTLASLIMLCPGLISAQTFEVRTINEDDNVKSRWDQEYAREQLHAVVDGDGREEEMIASYWERWGTVIIGDIVTTSKGEVNISVGCSRIGFMKTTTNGLHDIVCGRKDILRYDPESNRYQ